MTGVPGNVVAVNAVGKLHHAHAFLDEAAGDEAAFGKLALAVKLAGFLRFPGYIEHLRHGGLHAEGHFHRLDAGFKVLILFEAGKLHLIDLCQEVELLALLFAGEPGVLQIRDDCVGLHVVDIHVGTGIGTGQEGISPVGTFAAGQSARGHGDKARQVLRFRAQPVSEPSTEARAVGLEGAEVGHEDAAGVFGDVRVHRVDEGDIVHALRHFRKDVAHPLPALAILLEAKRRGHETHFGVPQSLAIHEGRTLTGVFSQHRLVVESIHLRWPARHEELDQPLRPRSEMRCLRCERRARFNSQGIAAEHGREPDGSNACAHFEKRFATR